MRFIPEDAEPACKYCAYYEHSDWIGCACTNPDSPHFTEPMRGEEGCSWIRPSKEN